MSESKPLTERLQGAAQEFFDYCERTADAAGIGMNLSPTFTPEELQGVAYLFEEAVQVIDWMHERMTEVYREFVARSRIDNYLDADPKQRGEAMGYRFAAKALADAMGADPADLLSSQNTEVG